ncbi:MAG TPA: sugar ABC transporter permease [Thermoanaerobaculia bacterium]|nr:sugar ABC transporter permease [Thermoanaerobaculia bacterium]
MTSEGRAAVWFLAPALTVIGVFFLLPVVGGFLLSLTDFDIYALADARNIRFVGVDQYRALSQSPVFWAALRNTLLFALLAGPLTVCMSLGAALLLSAKLSPWKPFFRTVYFAPVVTTLVAVAIVWRYMFHPRFGLLNTFLGWFGIGAIDWLGDPRFALPAIAILAIWKNFGYNMIIFVAGLQSVPEELYEAAKIDGAGAIRQFRHITLPMLGPTFLFVGIITAIGYLQLFAEPYVMTPDGGPLNSTLSVVMLMYREGFRWWSMGYAAAIAFVLFVIIVAVSLFQLWLRRRTA